MSKAKSDNADLNPVQSRDVVVGQSKELVHDAVFGELSEGGPNYRSLGWVGTTGLMMKTQIGLGVLSIPAVFDVLGIIPGVICLCAIGGITTWSNYIVGVFKLGHPEVYGIDDAGAMMFGRLGRIIFGTAFCCYFTCNSASAMLSVSIGLNAVSKHGACTAIFVFVAACVGFSTSSIRTLARLAWPVWVGLVGIIVSVTAVTIAVGVQDRPADAPREGEWKSDYKLVNSPEISKALSAISALVFSYAGTPAFFPIVSEMRNPKHYGRALFICQGVISACYITVGCVVYYYCGSYVASPALGSAGNTMKIVCYAIALPGLMVTNSIATHLPAKYIFVHALRGTKHLTSNTKTHWATWLGCTFGVSVIAYIIASAVPVFGSLISLVGALFGTLMSFQPMGCMWLYDNWSKDKAERNLSWTLMF
ncbi:hypothetical protein BHE90_017170 [Fusarium euwallaceae]|uniref:Amino acid transporter transmembrane domain-containing protein n=2 Tax=Fusarium solani species complex TaxID=232080 RepID=A0A428SHX6_9HYPO|nr:hypothetical protein CEP52_014929 [Fusarium oligoseptatum]RTE68453.1 hypothetical protein BHE90_017170 [Fusarium euwallaceae]